MSEQTQTPVRKYASWGDTCTRCGNIVGSLCQCELYDLRNEAKALREELRVVKADLETLGASTFRLTRRGRDWFVDLIPPDQPSDA